MVVRLLQRAESRPAENPADRVPWFIVVLSFTLASGVTVSAIYIPQPILDYVAADLSVNHTTAALTASLAQLGYALGVLMLLPLGEIRRPRSLIVVQTTLAAIALLACSVSPTLSCLCVFLFAAGAVAGVVQLLAPLASRLAAPGRRETATASIVAGLALGIFGGRAGATVTAEFLGWRWVYVIAGVLVMAMAILLGTVIDRRISPARSSSYWSMLVTMPGILRRSRGLRYAAGFQFCAFSSFNAAWTVASLHLGGVLGLDAVSIGLFSLIGLTSVLVVPFVGKVVKAVGYGWVRLFALIAGACSAVALLLGSAHVVVTFVAMAGMALMNFCIQVPNMLSFFKETGDASPRANSMFIFITFTGGAVGAQIGAALYESGGIVGTVHYCLAMIGLGFVLLAATAFRRRHCRRHVKSDPGAAR